MGYGNAGDEGILLAIIDSLGENEYIICTTLPHNMLEEYRRHLPDKVKDVRQIYDVRADYDAFILGGGALRWGYGWAQAINAWSHDKPSMNYGVGYSIHQLYHPRLDAFYAGFIDQFDALTVRDHDSLKVIEDIANLFGVELPTVTACPSINLKEESFDCPKGMIAVCPRYEDYESNDAQLDWLTNRLQNISDEVLLIPFAPYDIQYIPVDLSLCIELKRRLPRSQILNTSYLSPRHIKYAVSQSKLVITGGRYHAIVWASAHGVPFEVSPTCVHYPKIGAFEKMHAEYGGEKLKEMEKKNKEIFMEKCMK